MAAVSKVVLGVLTGIVAGCLVWFVSAVLIPPFLDVADRRGNDTHSARGGRGDAEAGSAGREGSLVIVPASGVKVLIATKPVDFRKGMDGPVDFRKGMDGLAAVVRESLGADPYGGVIHV